MFLLKGAFLLKGKTLLFQTTERQFVWKGLIMDLK